MSATPMENTTAAELLAKELCVRAHSEENVEINGIPLTGGVIIRACHRCMADAIDFVHRLLTHADLDDAPEAKP